MCHTRSREGLSFSETAHTLSNYSVPASSSNSGILERLDLKPSFLSKTIFIQHEEHFTAESHKLFIRRPTF